MNYDRRFGWGSLIAALVIGLLIGWFAIGWGLWPVSWTGTDPVDLRQEEREDYLLLVAGDYALTHDASVALDRLASWPSLADANREIRDLAEFSGAQGEPGNAQALRMLAQGLPLPVEQAPVQQPAAESSGSGTTTLSRFLKALAVAAAVVGIVALAVYLLRRRKPGPVEDRGDRLRDRLRDIASATQPESALDEVETGAGDFDYTVDGQPGDSRIAGLRVPGPPVEHRPDEPEDFVQAWSFQVEYAGEGSDFDRTFMLGEPGAEYLGECGVGATNVGRVDSDRISALEVWLFDRSDIHTVAKVLMSHKAYHNDVLREEVSSRGEPILAVPGTTFTLTGNRLQTEVTIDEVSYLPGAPAKNSFHRVALRLRSGKIGT